MINSFEKDKPKTYFAMQALALAIEEEAKTGKDAIEMAMVSLTGAAVRMAHVISGGKANDNLIDRRTCMAAAELLQTAAEGIEPTLDRLKNAEVKDAIN